MIPYATFLILLLIPIAGSAVWMAVVKGETEVFSKRLYKYAFTVFMMCAVLGAAGFLKRPPLRLSADGIFVVSFILILLLGVWHTVSLYKRHAWVWDHKQSFKLALPFSLFIFSVGALGYFLFFWMLEKPVFKTTHGAGIQYTSGFLLALLPVAVVWAHQQWNKIPVVTKELQAWKPAVDTQPPPLEPGHKSLPLSVHIPLKHNSSDIIQFDIRAPLDDTLDQIINHLLYRHNIEKGAIRKIEIAEDNKKSKIYGWVFFTAQKKWWWVQKTYLDPYDKVQYLGLSKGQKIFAERLKTW